MDEELKSAIQRFVVELKQDIIFFGASGFAVALFMIWQARLKELGVSENPTWANELFSEFMSLNAFGLVFFGYLIIASISSIFADFGKSNERLDRIVFHMESRLAQIASSIVAFMAGFLLLVLVYSLLVLDSGGIKLTVLTAALSLFMISTFVAAILVGRRSRPFDKWWVATTVVLVLAAVLGWLLIQNGK